MNPPPTSGSDRSRKPRPVYDDVLKAVRRLSLESRKRLIWALASDLDAATGGLGIADTDIRAVLHAARCPSATLDLLCEDDPEIRSMLSHLVAGEHADDLDDEGDG